MRAKQVAASFFAVIVVLTAVLAAPTAYSPAGTARGVHNCQFSDSLIFSISNSITGNNPSGCKLFHGDTSASSGSDSEETKTNLVTGAGGAFDHGRTYLTSSSNTLGGAESVARTVGLEAAYRAMENGSTKSQVRSEMQDAVRNHYSKVQANAIESYNTLALQMVDYESIENNDGGVPDTFVMYAGSSSESSYTGLEQSGNISYSLVDGESKDIVEITRPSQSYNYAPTSKEAGYTFYVGAQNDSYTTQSIDRPLERYNETIWKADQQSQDVVANLDTYINNTYDGYTEGTINMTDFLGPNTLAEEYAAEGDFQNWAVLRLSQMENADPPANLSQTGKFRIDEGLNTYEGILLSGENPPSGQFEAGGTYNSSDIPGSQYVVTNDSTHELTGEWTIESITNDDGQQIENTTISSVNYSVANTSDYQGLIDRMKSLRAELNARDDALGGGGGLLGGTFGTVGQLAAVAIVAGGGYLIMQNGGSGGSSGGGGSTTINVQERMKDRRDRKRDRK